MPVRDQSGRGTRLVPNQSRPLTQYNVFYPLHVTLKDTLMAKNIGVLS